MPVKRRVAKTRTPVISERALALFEQMRRCRRGSEQWFALHSALHAEVGAKPWQWPLDVHEIWQELAAAALAARQAATLSKKEAPVVNEGEAVTEGRPLH